MSAARFSFTIDSTAGAARAGVFVTPHGTVETPAFMAVGTQATVKTLDPRELWEAGARMILANAYHLHLRPGEQVIREMGGLHRFMHWDGPILTDSGGFQVFSLATLRRVSEEGVEFQSHIDGSRRHFSPESVIAIQRSLGADVIMQFDHVIPGQSDLAIAKDASERSLRWLERCLVAFRDSGFLDSGLGIRDSERRMRVTNSEWLIPNPESRIPNPESLIPNPEQVLFPIIQGGIHETLRCEAARAIRDMDDWAGFGIGGLSVGEAKPMMYATLEVVDNELPRDRPRYLMGVGFPEDLIEAVARGMDLFDCVAPTRMGRTGTAFTSGGRINVRRAELRNDSRPLDESCDCSTCARFSRSYVRHLFVAEEVLGLRLVSLHNVHFLVALMRRARDAIRDGTFGAWSRDWLTRHHSRLAPVS